MKEYYPMTIAGLERRLPLCPISDELKIGAFVIFGDPELTTRLRQASCCKRCPEHDVLITAESKGIPLICEMARQLGNERYMLARKGAKLYMRDVFAAEVHSITTDHPQTLYLDGADAEYMKRQARGHRGRRDLHRRVPARAGGAGASRAGGEHRGPHGHSGRGRRRRSVTT